MYKIHVYYKQLIIYNQMLCSSIIDFFFHIMKSESD